jgi:hypothetical protein
VHTKEHKEIFYYFLCIFFVYFVNPSCLQKLYLIGPNPLLSIALRAIDLRSPFPNREGGSGEAEGDRLVTNT